MSLPRNDGIKYFFVWFVLSLFIGLILYLFYESDSTRELYLLERDQNNAVRQFKDDIEFELNEVVADLEFLSNRSSLRDFTRHPVRQTFDRLNNALATELQLRSDYYSQLRLIALNGKELARVDNVNGVATVMPFEKLQDKSERYYIKQALKMDDHEAIYVSQVDLNVEHGKIQVPHRATIRFARKVYEGGELLALLVINYDMTHIIENFKNAKNKVWLLNNDGYFLTGPQEELEWGFLYPDRAHARFKNVYPDVWETVITNEDVVQTQNNNGLFTHTKIVISGHSSELSVSSNNVLHLVSHISNAEIKRTVSNIVTPSIILFITFILILGFSLFLIYRSSRMREDRAEEAAHSRLKFVQLIEFLPDAVIVCRPDGTIALANQHAEELFGYTRKELIGQSVNMLIPESKRSNHKNHIDTYTNAPSVRPMGRDVNDLKAINKKSEEFSVSISLGPVDSGEDMLIVSIIRELKD